MNKPDIKKPEPPKAPLNPIEVDKKLIGKLKGMYDLCKTEYAKAHKRMKILDSTDSGELWKTLNMKFPCYQILPDSNWVSYIKDNIVASVYTVGKNATIRPTSDQDKEIVTNLNVALEYIWQTCEVPYYQYMAGERAALLNVGVTQVGWDDTLTGGSKTSDTFSKGGVSLKNINPIKFMRDPFAVDLDHAGYCMTYDDYHKSVFESNPNYKDKFRLYMAQHKSTVDVSTPRMESEPSSKRNDYYTLFTYWVKDKANNINEYHVVNNEFVLYVKENIKPAMFPFAILYCNTPAGKLVGTSQPAKIFANNLAYNLLDSIALTAEYKNQRPPKFINPSTGLNIQQFAKHGDEADKTFIVSGDPSKAVHFQQFPQVSNSSSQLSTKLGYNIQNITGIDSRYSGRDTGSVTTTGGVEQMLDRVSMIDAPKITEYEKYTKRLTHLILFNYINFSPARKYFVKNPQTNNYETKEVDFINVDNATLFQYIIDISSELPDAKQRMAQMANTLMEKQMQYQQSGQSVDLMTPEEWLMFQDFPNKEYMMERMGVQRYSNALEDTSQVLSQFSELVKQGMDPNEAIYATANSLENTRQGNAPEQITPAVTGGEEQLPVE